MALLCVDESAECARGGNAAKERKRQSKRYVISLRARFLRTALQSPLDICIIQRSYGVCPKSESHARTHRQTEAFSLSNNANI
jgi:hypothetical protein